MKNYIQVEIFTESIDQQEMLIAILDSMIAEGFEQKDNSLKTFFSKDKFDELQLREVLADYSLLKCEVSEIPSVNWNEEWEKDFSPVRVGDFAAVRAHFHAPIAEVKFELVITPKMSFGTGHHATTHMVIELMSGLDLGGKDVYDFGTGTGILAILAEKMGAENITAIDNDDWSIENSKENLIQNSCSKIELKLGDQIIENKLFDLVIANINLNVIVPNLFLIKSLVKKNGVVLLSGFLKTDESFITSELEKAGFEISRTLEMNGWLSIQCTC